MVRFLDPNRIKNGNPLVKWRITTVSYIREFVHNLPKERMDENSFRSRVKDLYGGSFFTTAYQLYCQLGLYYISENGEYRPRFNHEISEDEASCYFSKWVKRYYVPNPYTKQGFNNLQKPVVILPSFVTYLKLRPSKSANFNRMCTDIFKEDIGDAANPLKSTLKNAGAPFTFEGTSIKLNENYEEFMEVNASRDDKKFFFKYIDDEINSSKKVDAFSPSQVIYYGVPGSGKSFEIEQIINTKIKSEKEREWRVSRVVFHPDYTNADFVGQILPVVIPGERISYKFNPGPFAKILRRAYLNPNKEFFLIIEEINRGNASAIFGDLFQLLDRVEQGKEPKEPGYGENKYSAGWSNYSIENQSICDYIRDKKTFDIEKQDDCEEPQHDANIETEEAKLDEATSYGKLTVLLPTNKKLTISENTQIRLPPNLSLYATMNTSDQNVFTLDNAFQRRWEMKQVSNDLKNDDAHLGEKNQYNQPIGSTNVKWGEFRERINELVMESAEENGLSSMEDKRLGGWFIIPKKLHDSEECKITDEAFAEKVLKYLWDDAFKFDRQKHFGDVKTLEALAKNFKKHGFRIFKDDSIGSLQKNVDFDNGNEIQASES